MTDHSAEVKIQRAYYTETAGRYDVHLEKDQEHNLALHLLAGYIQFYNIRSVLDVGAGTGRAMQWLKHHCPSVSIKGVEPVAALREQAFSKGVPREDLSDGSGYDLPYADGSFELVCEFAVLHHVKEPRRMIREMSRVAAHMVALSDCNFMGQGPSPVRLVKAALYLAGMWKLANWIKTKGTGYTLSEGDGLAYSYSLFQDLDWLNHHWRTVRTTSLSGGTDRKFGSLLSSKQLLMVASDKRAVTGAR